MIELVMTISVIGILIAGTTVYLGGSGEKRKIIEAQGCAATIGGELNNFIFYALTSKELDNTIGAPDYYRIGLDGGNSDVQTNSLNNTSFNDCTWECNYNDGCTDGSMRLPVLCENIKLKYKNEDTEQNYKDLNASNTCKQYSTKLRFMRKVDGVREGNTQGHGRPSNISYININKGFTPGGPNDTRVFYMLNADTKKTPLLGSIIILVCLDNDCKATKEIGKYDIDGRTQTISLNKCAFYYEDNAKSNQCEQRAN